MKSTSDKFYYLIISYSIDASRNILEFCHEMDLELFEVDFQN